VTRVLVIGSDPSRVKLLCGKRTVSGVHAELRRDEHGVFTLADLGSTNGTMHNGRRVREPIAIAIGDVISLGKSARFTLTQVHLDFFDQESATPWALEAEGGGDRAQEVPATTYDPSAAVVGPARVVGPSTQALSPGELAILRTQNPPSGPISPVPEFGDDVLVLRLGYAESNDVVISNPAVSARHARILLKDDRVFIEDQGSTNGTWVRGRRVESAEVSVGDPIALGAYRFTLDEAWLTRLRDHANAQETRRLPFVPGRVIRLGRSPDNDVVLAAATVSAAHATLEVLPGATRYRVTDQGSTNGVYLNQRNNQVSAAEVGPGEVLYLGSYRLPLDRVPDLLRGETKSVSLGARKTVFVVGRDARSVDVAIDSSVVSSRHAQITVLDDGRFEVIDLGSSNGTFVSGARVKGATIAAADARVSLGGCVVSLDPAEGVIRRKFHGEVMLQAERVSVDVPDKHYPGGKRRIVDDVTFTVFPTEFVGLMGPSGAGKTTLMLALNGYLPPSLGRSVINNRDLYRSDGAFRTAIGYVPQDDIVFPQLTVAESLRYTAKLRLPPDTGDAEIERRIDAVLDELEIAHTKNTRIGDALDKGISGGERKRVNLAQELLTDPSLLLLDEPTSGLASEDTINVMRLLRGLADGGRTILLTIHQPSLEAYRMMDNVAYLVRGRLVYYGPSYPDSIRFFHPDVPPGPESDRLLADPGNALKPLAAAQRAALASAQREAANEAVEQLADERRTAYEDSPYYKEFVVERAAPSSDVSAVELRGAAAERNTRRGVVRQWAILSRRAALIKWKDRVNTGILLAQAPIIAAVLSLVFARAGDAWFDHIARGPAALFLLVASAVWFGCSNSAREIVAERAVYRRERMVNLTLVGYVLSKATVLGLVCALQCALMLAIAAFPLGLSGSLPSLYAVLLLSSLAGLGMGLTLSALVASVEAATALVPLLLIPQIILGGVIMPIHEMGPATRALASLTAARWGFEAALVVEHAPDDTETVAGRCEIDDCVWGIGATGVSFSYYPGDPDNAGESAEFAGVEALQEGLIPAVAPRDEPLCHGFCPALATSDAITPIDRSFGVDPDETLRAEAHREIVEEGRAGHRWEAAAPNARTSLGVCASVLFGMIVFFHLLVTALLRARDVEVG
jgi:ABC-type multidrug transport system ATPase subunit/pSer/pThr/pTyr-binding forkhead associated (FHA) protein